MRATKPWGYEKVPQKEGSDLPPNKWQIEMFQDHLKKHKLRDLAIKSIESQQYSFFEELEIDDDGIVLKSVIGGEEKGNCHYSYFSFSEFSRSDDFDYKWGTILRHYSDILESFEETKNKIPKNKKWFK